MDTINRIRVFILSLPNMVIRFIFSIPALFNRFCNGLEVSFNMLTQALPLICSYVFGVGLIPIIILYFVGGLKDETNHTDPDVFAGVSLALMFTNVTGLSVLIGMAGAVETMASQLFGAGRLREVGYCVQRSILVLSMTCVPILIIWCLAAIIFHRIGISDTVCRIVDITVKLRMLGLPMDVFRCTFERYLTAVGVTEPLMIASLIFDGLLILLCILNNEIFGLGYVGIMLSFVIASYISGFYMLLTSVFYQAVKATLQLPHESALLHMADFVSLGLSGVVMLCSEWWAYEILTIFASLISTQAIDAQAIIITTIGLAYCVLLGVSMVVSVSIGNLIGQDTNRDAKYIGTVGLVAIVYVQTAISMCIYLFGHQYLTLFTNDTEVTTIALDSMRYLPIFVVGDGLQCIGGAILRGAGKQSVGALLNFISFYIVGLPMSWIFCFKLDYGVCGLLMGMSCANYCQIVAQLYLIYFCSDYIFNNNGLWLHYSPIPGDG